MKRWKRLTLFIGMLVCLQGCSVPRIKINPIELPQHGLDFRVASNKTTYQLGEPVVIKVRVKNFRDKTRTLRILPNEKLGFSFEYRLDTFFSPTSYWGARYSSDKTIALTIPPNKEVEISEMTWVWDQTDAWLKEPVGVGRYVLRFLTLGNVEVDGQSVGSVGVELEEGWLDGKVRYLVDFKITHPVYEEVKKKDISFSATSKYVNGMKELISIEAINWSEQQQTVSVKPVGANPPIRIRILGPVSSVDRPPLRAVYEVREIFSITLPPRSSWVTVMDFTWDFRDQMTGELVPIGYYKAVIEICGTVEINGEVVGTIENPIGIFSLTFKKEG